MVKTVHFVTNQNREFPNEKKAATNSLLSRVIVANLSSSFLLLLLFIFGFRVRVFVLSEAKISSCNLKLFSFLDKSLKKH